MEGGVQLPTPADQLEYLLSADSFAPEDPGSVREACDEFKMTTWDVRSSVANRYAKMLR